MIPVFRLRKGHRWLGVVVGVQLALWILSGIYFAWSDIDMIHGDEHRVDPVPPVADSAWVSPADVEGVAGAVLASAEPVDLLHHTLRNGGTFRDFFLSDVTTTRDPRLAAIYGVGPAATGGTVALPAERHGILSRVGLLLARADVALPNINSITHPILRGVFIRRQITCDYLPAAPGGAMDDLPIVDRSVTGSREATEILTGATGCSGCHGRINPTGYALERFDPIGQWRESEPLFDATGAVTAELPIDDSATIAEADGAVAGAAALAESLYDSEKVGACFARHYLRFALARAEDPERDGCLLAELDEAIDADRPLTEVLSAVVLDPSFRVRAAN